MANIPDSFLLSKDVSISSDFILPICFPIQKRPAFSHLFIFFFFSPSLRILLGFSPKFKRHRLYPKEDNKITDMKHAECQTLQILIQTCFLLSKDISIRSMQNGKHYRPIHVIRPDIVGTYQYWAPKYESRPTDRNSRYIWISNFRFCQKLKLVFRSPQTLALSKLTTGSGNRSLLVFRTR